MANQRPVLLVLTNQRPVMVTVHRRWGPLATGGGFLGWGQLPGDGWGPGETCNNVQPSTSGCQGVNMIHQMIRACVIVKPHDVNSLGLLKEL